MKGKHLKFAKKHSDSRLLEKNLWTYKKKDFGNYIQQSLFTIF